MAEPELAPSYPSIDPASVTPLEVLYFPEPVGPGYARAPIEIGPTLYTGKWLGLANPEARFMGPKHVIVNHFRSPPRQPGNDDTIKNVLLDVETGEAVAEFEYGRYVQWHFGLAIVYQADDERPYLLDAEAGALVLAVPEGEHNYALGDNYWLRFSPIARRLWVYARDQQDVVHLYAWDDLSKPPELPNNPFPFMPEFWNPDRSTYFSAADSEEVQPQNRGGDCSRAILIPPKGYECLDAAIDDTLPLAGGWRVDDDDARVFTREGQGFDLSTLCPAGQTLHTQVLARAPARVRLTCTGDPDVWMVWSPPDRVQRMDPAYARKVNAAKLIAYHHPDIDRYELLGETTYGPEFDTWFNADSLVLELVGDNYNYDCTDTEVVSGNGHIFARGCMRQGGRISWSGLTDTDHKLRARVQAADVLVSPNGLAIGIMRRGGRDQVVRLAVGGR